MGVITGMDPHKRSATIEVIDERGRVLEGGRFGTDKTGYAAMLAAGGRYPERVWAIEGCNGIGKHLAHRLVHDGETVLDVPPKLSAQVRVFATGNGRKTDPVDAHSVAMVALRTASLVKVQVDPELVALEMLADRRDETPADSDSRHRRPHPDSRTHHHPRRPRHPQRTTGGVTKAARVESKWANHRPRSTLACAATARLSCIVTNQDHRVVAAPLPAPTHPKITMSGWSISHAAGVNERWCDQRRSNSRGD